jgi:hypothetical protein
MGPGRGRRCPCRKIHPSAVVIALAGDSPGWRVRTGAPVAVEGERAGVVVVAKYVVLAGGVHIRAAAVQAGGDAAEQVLRGLDTGDDRHGARVDDGDVRGRVDQAAAGERAKAVLLAARHAIERLGDDQTVGHDDEAVVGGIARGLAARQFHGREHGAGGGVEAGEAIAVDRVDEAVGVGPDAAGVVPLAGGGGVDQARGPQGPPGGRVDPGDAGAVEALEGERAMDEVELAGIAGDGRPGAVGAGERAGR